MADEGTAAMTVLIVDDDLGFVWWLGDIFNEAGARCVPALSCGAAMVLTKRLNPVAIHLRKRGVELGAQGHILPLCLSAYKGESFFDKLVHVYCRGDRRGFLE